MPSLISEGKTVRARFLQSGDREEKAFQKDTGEDAKGCSLDSCCVSGGAGY